MDFTKDNERFSYRSGYFLGFLFSYLLFFSMLFFILSRFNLIHFKYLYYLGALVVIYLGYRLVERPARRMGG